MTDEKIVEFLVNKMFVKVGMVQARIDESITVVNGFHCVKYGHRVAEWTGKDRTKCYFKSGTATWRRQERSLQLYMTLCSE